MQPQIPVPIKLAVAASALGLTALLATALDHLSKHQGMASTTPRIRLERVVINGSREPAAPSVASAASATTLP